tara:strand:+ start:187 stop:1458 length:1272 start_codon:yes stop_codon:yes gene_type:complete
MADSPRSNFTITGYLQAFTKEMKEKDGIEPTMDDWNAAIEILCSTDVIEECDIRCAVMQVEEGEGGTQHLQAFLQTIKKRRIAWLSKRIREHTPFTFSIQESMGNAQQNVAYATKPTGPWEYADGRTKMNKTLSPKPIWINKSALVKKGERSDIKEAIRAAENGSTLRELDQRFPTVMARSGRGIKDIIFRKKMAESKQNRLGRVFIFTGGTGCGKSWEARNLFSKQIGLGPDDVFSLDFENRNLWFDGYNGEKILLLDDYVPNSITRSKFLRLLDIYQFPCQVKGGYTIAEWDYVFITTNYPVDSLCTFPKYNEETKEVDDITDPAFASRITGVIDYQDMPDLRNPDGDYQTINRKDWDFGNNVPKSVESLLPSTLEHGTFQGNVTGSKAGAGSQTRPVILPESTLEHLQNNGTFQEDVEHA